MFGIGAMELAILFPLVFSSGGLLGLPLSVVPLPPDPVVARAAPDACLFHLATAGLATPDAAAGNLTERMLADDEMRTFLADIARQIVQLGRQWSPLPPDREDAVVGLIEVVLTRPLALTVRRFQPPAGRQPPELVASLLVRVGDRGADVERRVDALLAPLVASMPAAARPRPLLRAGGTWQQLATPVGPLTWGVTDDGSFVVAVGPEALELLLADIADKDRAPPAWFTDLERRLPVDRRSTLAYFDAADVLRRIAALPVADADRLQGLLDASGIADLQSVGAVSGLTAEGFASFLWLGCDGPPRGLLAGPAAGITEQTLTRLPAQSVMTQAWSLDLSAFLATTLDIIAAADPAAAAQAREGIEQIRAVAGIDIDRHLLQPLGPEWAVSVLPVAGGVMPNIALSAGVRDRPTFARTHKALLGILRNATAGGDVRVDVREVDYRGQTLFCLETSGEEVALPVTPTWCLTDDRLLVTLSPQLMKTLLTRSPEDAGLDSVPEVRAALGDTPPAFVGAVDPQSLLGTLCGLYEMAVPLARQAAAREGYDVDLPQLPRAEALMRFARPAVTTIRHADDGVLLATTGTVPLGPLTGGGLLGVSPVSTPVLVALLLPAVQSAREAARRAQTMNQFKQIMLAMHNHHDARNRLPAQAICAADGTPLLSWRVAILPYLGEEALYEQFRLDEPWDSEHNRAIIPRMPLVYADPNAPPEQFRAGLTTVQLLTGDETLFRMPTQAPAFRDIIDGMSNTLAVIEVTPDHAVPWTKPEDHAFAAEQPLEGIGNPRRAQGLFIGGFWDGSVRALVPQIDPETFRALVTPAGGETVRRDAL